jgi:hypothetical protein
MSSFAWRAADPAIASKAGKALCRMHMAGGRSVEPDGGAAPLMNRRSTANRCSWCPKSAVAAEDGAPVRKQRNHRLQIHSP